MELEPEQEEREAFSELTFPLRADGQRTLCPEPEIENDEHRTPSRSTIEAAFHVLNGPNGGPISLGPSPIS